MMRRLNPRALRQLPGSAARDFMHRMRVGAVIAVLIVVGHAALTEFVSDHRTPPITSGDGP